jgi:putative transcriptional regulator
MLASRRLFLALAALPALLFGATSLPAEAAGRAFLTGQLLIATPSMGDPRFEETVILMVRHNETGALGIIINRPAGERPLAALLEALGEKDTNATGTIRIFAGGPVSLATGLVLHSSDYRHSSTIDIDGRLAMTPNPQILRDMAAGNGPSKSLFALGYAGWGPGQLESELAQNAWYTAPADPGIVFDDDREKVWEHARERRTQDL